MIKSENTLVFFDEDKNKFTDHFDGTIQWRDFQRKVGMETIMKADMAIYIDQWGDSHFLKNRWGNGMNQPSRKEQKLQKTLQYWQFVTICLGILSLILLIWR